MSTKYIVNNLPGQTIDGNPIDPKYKVFTALVSQSGLSNELTLSSGAVTKGVTYRIDGASDGDFSNVGSSSNEASTYFIATNDGVPNSYGSATLLYNPGAPVALILENTIGDIWWAYDSPGRYSLSSDSLFIDGKTFINGANFTNPVFNRIIGEGGEGFSVQKGYFFFKSSESLIQLKTLQDAETLSDDIISNPICIEIRVYN